MATTARSPATEADLLRMPNDGRKYELVDGEIRVSPAGARHGLIIIELAARLLAFVKRTRSGYVFDSSTGIRLPKGNVRSPDISFVARRRFKKTGVPEARSASVYRSLTAVRTLSEKDALSGEDVLRGFRCRLRDLL